MKKYVKHIVTAIICFLAIVALNFALPRLIPGDPVAYLTGFDEEEMAPEKYEYYYHALHLDESIGKQFGYYLKSIFDGSLGYSYKQEAQVSKLIGEKVGYSLQITVPAAIISIVISLFWGLRSGLKKDKLFDRASTAVLIVQNTMPSFLIALVLAIVFCVDLKWFPYSGLNGANVEAGTPEYFGDRIYHLIMPILAVVLASLPAKYLLVRNTAAKFADDKSVSYAMERGLSPIKIEFGYMFKNIAQPFIAMVGSTIGGCIGGSVLVESVFSINGIGGLLNSAVYTLDYPLMQGILFVTTLSIIVCVVSADILCILINPAVRKRRDA